MAARSCKFTGGAWFTHRGVLPGAPSETSNMLCSIWFKGRRTESDDYGSTLFSAGTGAQSVIRLFLNQTEGSSDFFPTLQMGIHSADFQLTTIPDDGDWHNLIVALRTSGSPAALGYLDNTTMGDGFVTERDPAPPEIGPQACDEWCIGGDLSGNPTSHIGELTALEVYLEDDDYVTLIADANYRRQFITDSGWAADIGGTGFIMPSTLKPPTIYASGNVAAFTQSLPQLPALSPIMSSINLGLWKHEGNAIVVDGLSDPFIDG